jgi:ParB-like chromosome segregation protein Spo0J
MEIVADITTGFEKLDKLPIQQRVYAINIIRQAISAHSPFKSEPVDCVLWIDADDVTGNSYNPNSVAPPEMKLLEHSILADGFTQPIVAWEQAEGGFEVVDGFHRNRVGRECESVRKRVHGYLPIAAVSAERHDRGDRIAATIRHNRARGKHQVEAMSDIVVELKRRNWSDEKIGKELGMDTDEILRLTQITGIAEMFSGEEFSKAWEIGTVDESELLTDESAELDA